jgi:hypothetical protein
MKTVALMLLIMTPIFAEKKLVPVPQTWPTSRTFAATCDAVWPAAVQVLTLNGWGIKTSDRAGGILTLEWTRGENLGPYRRINPMVGQYTVEKNTGFWTQYTGFRMVSAQAVAVSQGDGCSYTITAVYHGREIRVGQGQQWWILQSNGFLEDKMLREIEVKLVK